MTLFIPSKKNLAKKLTNRVSFYRQGSTVVKRWLHTSYKECSICWRVTQSSLGNSWSNLCLKLFRVWIRTVSLVDTGGLTAMGPIWTGFTATPTLNYTQLFSRLVTLSTTSTWLRDYMHILICMGMLLKEVVSFSVILSWILKSTWTKWCCRSWCRWTALILILRSVLLAMQIIIKRTWKATRGKVAEELPFSKWQVFHSATLWKVTMPPA